MNFLEDHPMNREKIKMSKITDDDADDGCQVMAISDMTRWVR
jgi:hypothetical protein